MKIAKRAVLDALAFLMVALAVSGAEAQPSTANPNQSISFKLSSEVLDESSTQMAGGIDVLASEWPALIISVFTRKTVFGPVLVKCTAALVGPNVALMAAHCVDAMDPDQPRALMASSLTIATQRYPFVCEAHPDYMDRPMMGISPRGSEDYALCVLDDKGAKPGPLKSMRFEVLEAETPLRRGDMVLMTGYGCDHIQVVNGRPKANSADGKLRIGNAEIESPPGSLPDATNYVTVRSGSDAEPTLCPGDSGGPLFSGISMNDPDKQRRVRGVNSSLDTERVSTIPDRYNFISSMAATGTPAFRRWADEWLLRNAAYRPELCGRNVKPGIRQCRE